MVFLFACVRDFSQFTGRYNLLLPNATCSCGKSWSPGMDDLVDCGYWPATVNFETLYDVNLFTTYEDLKITAPAMSRQAFISMLDHRTKLYGRVSMRWNYLPTSWKKCMVLCCYVIFFIFVVRVAKYVGTPCKRPF